MNGSATCSGGDTGPARSPTVLHVDDDPVFLELTSELLGRVGVEVLSEAEPAAVADRLETATVDAIVSDYDMPVLDGGALLERVRAEHPSIPFVLFTGLERGELPADVTDEGRARYVQKRGATSFDRLASTVRSVVDDADGHAVGR
jgi:CheY-like chemotaxis protein